MKDKNAFNFRGDEDGLCGWRTQKEYNLWRKWGYSGTVPGAQNPAANFALEESEKSTMRQAGASSEEEWISYRKNWKEKTYGLAEINLRRQRSGLTLLTGSGYHCSACGCYSNPFAYENYKELLSKNTCLQCRNFMGIEK